jgi:hypothetical protein
MILFISLIVFFFNIIYADSIPKFKIGGTLENLESRFTDDSSRSKTNPYVFINYKNINSSIEKREKKTITSFEFKNDYIYFSAGGRFKPIYGFYILRDEKYYSAFQNPRHGIIPQPLKDSIWLGFFPIRYSFGFFMGDEISKKNPSFYFKTPNDILSITYSPESKLYFHSLNLRDFTIYPSYILNLSSQGIGKKENYSGYFNTKLIIPKDGLEIENSYYRDFNQRTILNTNDDIRPDSNFRGNFLKFSRMHYNRLEYFQGIREQKTERIWGGNISVFTTGIGAICISARVYENLEKDKINTTESIGLSYEYRLLSTEFMLRLEERKNKDRLGELKWTYRPLSDWKFEISSLIQKDTNEFRSLFEQWSDGENINTILTDRAYAFKLKVISNFIILNISGSRRKNITGETYFANIQFKQEF